MGNLASRGRETTLLLPDWSERNLLSSLCCGRGILTACSSDKTVIGGVNACGKVWKLGSGNAALSPDGKLVVDLHGLVLNKHVCWRV